MSNYYWKLSCLIAQSILIIVLLLVELGSGSGEYKKNPTLTYPLSPDDYEYGLKLVKERGKNDGKSARNLRSVDTETTDKSTDFDDKKEIIPKLRRNQKVDWERKWPNGTIPYILAKGFTKEERAYMAYGFQEFGKYSCVRLAARINEESFLVIDKHSKKNYYCGGTVGRSGGQELLSLGLHCIQNTGRLEHELMHIFGFWHEQSRIDRDKYVKVLYENIEPKSKNQFGIFNGTKHSNYLTKYDYSSVMHYGNKEHSKNGKPTLKRKLGDPNGKLGQLKIFTKLDLQKIKRLYKCKGNKNDYFKKRNADFKSTTCEDMDPKNCGTWKQKNYCKRLMFFYCKKTCDLCKSKQTCRGVQPKHCEKWKKKNYCYKFRDYMIIFCAKTCRLCK